MPKKPEGGIIARSDRPGLWARVVYRDQSGRQRVFQRKVNNRTEGKLLLKQKLREIEEHGAAVIEGDRLPFSKLATIYEEKRLFEPTITPSGKTIGLKSYASVRRRLKTLTAHFGRMMVKSITHADIEQFKRERLATPPVRKPEAQRTEADVNRNLQLLRNVFTFAVRQGWIAKNPFSLGEPLISIASEVRRERVLSREEEERLILACAGPRLHLRPVLICALDTAMRRGEILKLRWKDVNLVDREITVRATNTKTGKERIVPVSGRLHGELSRLKAVAIEDPEAFVFGLTDIKRSFASACRKTGIQGFRFHDCRHTALTRWTESGMPPMQLMAISGHTQMQTFSRYVNADRTALRRAADAMDEWHSVKIEPRHSEFVN